jgi:hypothetical protein
MVLQTRSKYQGLPRQLGELHVAAELPRDIVLQHLACLEPPLVPILTDNLRGAAVATVGAVPVLHWRILV